MDAYASKGKRGKSALIEEVGAQIEMISIGIDRSIIRDSNKRSLDGQGTALGSGIAFELGAEMQSAA